MTGHKCSDFSIDNLLKSETKRRKYPDLFYFHELTTEGVKLKNLNHTQKQESSEKDHCNDLKQKEQGLSKGLVSSQELDLESQTLSWLNCTRFNPPKVTRSRKRGSTQERCLGRGPRIPFSPGQISVLENTFSRSRYLSSDSIARLANALDLSNDRVKIWFQNRRARFKRERVAEAVILQSQFTTLKSNSNHTHNWTPAPQSQSADVLQHFFAGGSSYLPQTCRRIMQA